MRKNSPRLVAGILVLGLFSFVGVMVMGAFGAPTAAQGTEVRSDAKASTWDETRKGTTTKP